MKKLLLITTLLATSLYATAQKGLRQLQISAQIARPTSDLLTLTNIGYGAAVKGIYGFGEGPQQATLEAGYNRFPIKHLPDGVKVYYAATPVYAGYRYLINQFSLEGQAGISINTAYGSNSTMSLSKTSSDFGWALGVGYTIKGLEVALRYQVSDTRGVAEDLTFLGLRVAYNLKL
ncbi:outer membrane beta-barrel protein [Pedobacter duraquae]|uniref:Outer membrane protein with beta-barrel domain n=1 Tax=Pedobacter duraquae TaxID=425511 RepID=A0A4R6IED5_9SPHI|nr:outer membrane beta-barrel protein [Pedobacter duraquae]TDO19978.1 outer membrane protein with beta-barrel domain [Pedobacter duraquae]